jgi:hypothetical protein
MNFIGSHMCLTVREAGPVQKAVDNKRQSARPGFTLKLTPAVISCGSTFNSLRRFYGQAHVPDRKQSWASAEHLLRKCHLFNHLRL